MACLGPWRSDWIASGLAGWLGSIYTSALGGPNLRSPRLVTQYIWGLNSFIFVSWDMRPYEVVRPKWFTEVCLQPGYTKSTSVQRVWQWCSTTTLGNAVARGCTLNMFLPHIGCHSHLRPPVPTTYLAALLQLLSFRYLIGRCLPTQEVANKNPCPSYRNLKD